MPRLFSLILGMGFLCFQFAWGGNAIDSLEQLLPAVTDTQKAGVLSELSNAYRLKDADKSIDYAQQLIQYSREINYPKGEQQAWHRLGQVYQTKGNYPASDSCFQQSIEVAQSYGDSVAMSQGYTSLGNLLRYMSEFDKAMEYLQIALAIADTLHDQKAIANALINIANIHYFRGDYATALEYYIKTLRIREAIGDKGSIADCYNNIGVVQSRMENFKKAEEYHLKSLEIRLELNDLERAASSYNNLGNVYRNLEDLDKALEYHLNSMKLNRQIGNKSGIAISESNVGDMYMLKKNYAKALEHQTRALEINHELGDERGVAYAKMGLGWIYMESGNIKKAISLYKEAIAIAKELKAARELLQAYQDISEIYEKANQPSLALEFYKLSVALDDSLFNEEKNKQMTELEAKYENDIKEKEIELYEKRAAIQDLEISKQDAELDKQRFLINMVLALLAFAVVAAYLIFYRYTQKKRAHQVMMEKNRIIENQKNKIVESINYAKRIQESILMTEDEFKQFWPNSFIYYEPKDIVSGDFYWFSKQNGKSFIAAVDCTGHGVPGAFMSMIGNMLLKEIVNERKVSDPAQILEQLHQGVLDSLKQNELDALAQDGMDMTLCVLDSDKKELLFAGAMNPIYVVVDGKLSEVEGDVVSIGGKPLRPDRPDNRQFTTQRIPFQKDMVIYLFTDGYMDQFGGGDNSKFNMHRFKDLVLKQYKQDMELQKQQFIASWKDWKGTHEQIDDVLLIGLRLN